LLVLLSVCLSACAGQRLSRDVELSEQLGNWDQAVLQYLELLSQEPSNLTYRTGLLRAKIQASHQHFETAKEYRDAGVPERAMVEFQEAVELDPTNQYAFAELQKVRAELAAQKEERDYITSLDAVKERTRGALAQPPVLDPRSREPIDLNFPEPVSVMDIYRALGKAFGINVLFDPKMRDEEISIELQEVTAQDALEILIRTAGHFYKVLDPHSIIVVPDTTQNRRAYTDLIIQTFFLSNAEVDDVQTMLRQLIDSRKIAVNPRLNAIVLRDSADKVKVAERLIRTNDKARAEVVVDVELLQIDTNKLREVGLSIRPRGIQIGLDGGSAGDGTAPANGTGSGGSLVRFSDLKFLDSSSWFVNIPTFLIDFMKDRTEAQTLARPQLRISEGEKGSVVIADQVPIPVTSFNTANTIGGNIVPLTSYQYQDVGITIEIEPRVHHNNEISLVVMVEVSNIAGTVEGGQPIIGTRKINTTIRLKDGETNFLAGLIRTDESISEEGVAGLSDIPILGRLFSKKSTQNKRTDIVLTLTPHIIRRADVTEEDLLPIWVGTDTNFSFRGGSPALESQSDGPFDAEEERARALERRQERLERLPEALRNRRQQQDEENGQEPARGIDLVPSSSPNPPPSAAALAPPALSPPSLSQEVPGLGDPAATFEPLTGPQASEVFSVSQLGDRLAEPQIPRVEISVEPSAVVLEPGETFEAALRIEARSEVAHLPMTLSYDPRLLELIETREGSFLGDRGESQILLDSSEDGFLTVGASRLGGASGVDGAGSLLHLSFRARAAGEGALEVVKVRALDSSLGAIGPLKVTGSRVVVVSRTGSEQLLPRESPSRRPLN
jgi:general secretion pathway protein D